MWAVYLLALGRKHIEDMLPGAAKGMSREYVTGVSSRQLGHSDYMNWSGSPLGLSQFLNRYILME